MLLCSSPVGSNPQPNPSSKPLLPLQVEPSLCNQQTPAAPPPFHSKHPAHPEKASLQPKQECGFPLTYLLELRTRSKSCAFLGCHCRPCLSPSLSHKPALFETPTLHIPPSCTDFQNTPFILHIHTDPSSAQGFASWLPAFLSTTAPAGFLIISMYVVMTHPPCWPLRPLTMQQS